MFECKVCEVLKEQVTELKSDKERLRLERDALQETLFRITRLSKPTEERVMPKPVGGFETMTQRRIRLRKAALEKAAGKPEQKGWTKEQIEETENEVLGVQRGSETEEVDSRTGEDSGSSSDSTKH